MTLFELKNEKKELGKAERKDTRNRDSLFTRGRSTKKENGFKKKGRSQSRGRSKSRKEKINVKHVKRKDILEEIVNP